MAPGDAFRCMLARELRIAGLDVVDVRLALDALNTDLAIKVAVVDRRVLPGTLTGTGFACVIQHRDRRRACF
jgi:hypothetical protein